MTGPRIIAPAETGSADREEKRRLDDALDVEPQQVVLGQAEAADGWFGF